MLQPWLVGLTAVVVFLFIVFVVLLINRLWNLRRHRLDWCGGWGGLAGRKPRGRLPWAGAGLSPGTAQPLSPRRKEDEYPETLDADRYHTGTPRIGAWIPSRVATFRLCHGGRVPLARPRCRCNARLTDVLCVSQAGALRPRQPSG